MDSITSLPEGAGYNGVFTCVDRLVKLTKLLHCYVGERELFISAIAKLFFGN